MCPQSIGGGAGGEWNEDGNSPANATGANSITVNLADEYDEWRFVVTSEDTASSGNNVTAQLNGDTGSNYDSITQDGTVSSISQTDFISIHVGNDTNRSVILVSGRWDRASYIWAERSAVNTSAMLCTENTQITSPLTSITFKRGASTDWTVYAEGRDF